VAQVTSSAPPNVVPGSTPPAQAQPARGGPIRLLNDPQSGGTVRFLINGQEQSLNAGQSIDLPPGQPLTVDFNSGGPAGDRQFPLYDGLYKFKVTDDGWGLFKSSDRAGPAPPGMRLTNVPTPPGPSPDLAHRRRAARKGRPLAQPETPAPPSANIAAPAETPPTAPAAPPTVDALSAPKAEEPPKNEVPEAPSAGLSAPEAPKASDPAPPAEVPKRADAPPPAAAP
jgi:hypothetical protein